MYFKRFTGVSWFPQLRYNSDHARSCVYEQVLWRYVKTQITLPQNENN